MPKDEWGVKRVCPSCTNRFYDLQHDPMTCPNCGASFTVDSLTEVKPRVMRAEKEKPVVDAEVEELPELDEDAAIETDDEIEDDLLEDDDDSVSLEEIADVGGDEDEE